jgi:hypothetical protein
LPFYQKVGMFMAGAMFYSLAHCLMDDESNWATIPASIQHMWGSYESKLRELMQDRGSTSGAVNIRMTLICQEAIGWAGLCLWRLSSPNVFGVVLQHFFKLPDGLEAKLTKFYNYRDDENGLAVLRDGLSKLAGKALVLGFGDSAYQRRLQLLDTSTTEEGSECNEEPGNDMEELQHDIHAVKELLTGKLFSIGNEFSGRRASRMASRRNSSLRTNDRRPSDSSLIFAIGEMEAMLKGL